MDDDFEDFEDGEEPLTEPLNWADVVWSLLAVPYYIAKGAMVAIENIQKGLAYTSVHIDEKRRFAREAGSAIESMTRGEG